MKEYTKKTPGCAILKVFREGLGQWIVLSASSLASSHLLRQQNFLDLTKVTIGTATERYTERVFRSTDSKAEFLELCRDFWVVAAKEAQARLPLKDGVLKAARFLEPLRGNLIDGSTLVSLAEQFPQVIPSDQLDELRRQWQEYQVDADVSPADDVANFWKHVSGLLTSGSTRYSLVVKLAAAMLTIPHSSAGIERNFSQMGAAKTAGRNSISTEMLSSLMTIQCNRGNDTCLTFKPTPDMRRALPGTVARFAGRRWTWLLCSSFKLDSLLLSPIFRGILQLVLGLVWQLTVEFLLFTSEAMCKTSTCSLLL